MATTLQQFLYRNLQELFPCVWGLLQPEVFDILVSLLHGKLVAPLIRFPRLAPCHRYRLLHLNGRLSQCNAPNH